MKFTNTSLFLAAVACSAGVAANAEKMDRSRHASAIADLSGNKAIESFHKDLYQAARAIEQHKEAWAKSLRALASAEDSEGTCEEELEKCKAARLAPS